MKKVFSSIMSFTISAAIAAGCMTAHFTSFAEDIVQEYVMDGCGYVELALPSGPELLINNNREAYNYGYTLNEDQTKSYNLDENNAVVYERFKELIAPSESAISITLPKPVIVEDISGSNKDTLPDNERKYFEEVLLSTCLDGIRYALFDIPELFWIDPGKLSIGYKYSYSFYDGKYQVIIKEISINPRRFDTFETMDDVNIYRSKLEGAVSDFVPKNGGSRYDMLKEIHDNISLFTYYDLDARFSSSALGSLVEPGVVCEGYSEGFKLICDRLNIPCVCVVGDMNTSTNVGHMWNYVQMEDGKWYLVDVTWDDYDGKNGIEVCYDWFLKGSKGLGSKHVPEDYASTSFVYPTLAEDDFDPENVVTTAHTTTTTTTTTTVSTTSTTSRTGTSETSSDVITVSTTTTAPEDETTGTTSSSSTVTSDTGTTSETGTSTTSEKVTTSTTTSGKGKSSTTTATDTSTTTETSTTDTGTTSSDVTTSTTTSGKGKSTTSTVTDTSTTSSDVTTSTTTSGKGKSTTSTATDTSTTTKTSTTDTGTTSGKTTTTTETSETTDTTESTTRTRMPIHVEPLELEYDRGDVNKDGLIDIADLVCCINTLLGRNCEESDCDVDENGIVNVFDIICMRRIFFDVFIK